MQFTQKSLQTLVCRTFFKADTSPYVVPLQGNFQDPQDPAPEIPGVWLTPAMRAQRDIQGLPQTWIGFEKKDSTPRTVAAFSSDDDGTPEKNATRYSVVYKLSRCRLQIVGRQAEDWAESVSHWLNRQSVLDNLVELDAMLLADGLGRVETSVYSQDGLNTVWAYNVYFTVEWASTIDDEGTQFARSAEISGTLTEV